MTTTTDPNGTSAVNPPEPDQPEPDQPGPAVHEPAAGCGSSAVTARTEELAKALGEAFDGFDTRIRRSPPTWTRTTYAPREPWRWRRGCTRTASPRS